MTAKQAWNIFEQTGSVEAYLLYQQLKNEAARAPESDPMPDEPYYGD